MISLDEIISFIVPVFFLPDSFLAFGDDVLQTVFFTTIFTLFIITVIAVLINANEKSWDGIWYGKDDTKKFDVEYITVEEVNEAAETKSEKLAKAMPGMLLTVGLLGTFIGLGIALDKASSILANTSSVENSENQMIQLMAMLDGLGAKFKTSTWGLLAFVFLNLIVSFIGSDSKRLEWSANRVKKELERVKKDKKDEGSLRNTELSNQLINLSTAITKVLVDTQSENKYQLVMMTKFTEDLVGSIRSEGVKQSARFEKSMLEFNEKHDLLIDFFSSSFKDLSKEYKASFTEVIKSFDNRVEIANIHHENNSSLINTLFSKIEAENDLREKRFVEYALDSKSNHAYLVGIINKNIDRVVSTAIDHQEDNKSLQKKIILQNKDVRDAMVGFIEKNEKVVDALSAAATNMSDAATGMGVSASQLESVISNLRVDMEGIISLLKNDLSTSITDMNASFSKNMGGMTNSLKGTITDLNNSFKFNISEMSDNLKGATGDISDAVKTLSSNVEFTMTEVTQTIKESMDIQTKAQEDSKNLQVRAQSVFIESTDNLNEHIIGMTGLVDKLSDDIMNGLNAVSSSNRNMIGLTKKVEGLFEKLDSLSALQGVLKDLNETIKISNIVDFTPIIERKTQHHNELLSKVESVIERISESKTNISEELILALRNQESNKSVVEGVDLINER